jgi:hypothetical protein
VVIDNWRSTEGYVGFLEDKADKLEAENKRLHLDAHTKDAFYGAAIEERDSTIARLREAINAHKDYYYNRECSTADGELWAVLEEGEG